MLPGRVTNGSLHQGLDVSRLRGIDGEEVFPRLERENPKIKANNHAKHAADGHHVPPKLEPYPRRCDDARERKHKGNEDHDGVYDSGCRLC